MLLCNLLPWKMGQTYDSRILTHSKEPSAVIWVMAYHFPDKVAKGWLPSWQLLSIARSDRAILYFVDALWGDPHGKDLRPPDNGLWGTEASVQQPEELNSAHYYMSEWGSRSFPVKAWYECYLVRDPKQEDPVTLSPPKKMWNNKCMLF